MRDFSLLKYQLLLEELLAAGYSLLPVVEFLCTDSKKAVALRHDVDRHILRALAMARIEHGLRLQSTYYFRKNDILNSPEIIKAIAELGHETGYHYETLSHNNGDMDAAYSDFCNTLSALRNITWADGVCAHGSPFSKYNNTDLWRNFSYRQAGAAYELSCDIRYDNVCYLSDTGRRWDSGKFNIRDRVAQPWKFPHIKTTDDLFVALGENLLPDKILLNVHPQRWNDRFWRWFIELVGQWVKNGVKRGLVVVSCGLWVFSCWLFVFSCRLWVVGCGLAVVGCGLWVVREDEITF
jgi:hypothetical protein